MPDIQILSPHVADLIAAGEVVERPASVVKELVENAIDAGARTVTVEIRGGGMTYLRVTDDGCGMAPEDAGVAFLRHATSKLRDARGLESIATLGFRGEALAAISAVSHVELLTRQQGAASGTRVTLSAGEIEEMYETGCPEGTTMIIRDLFYNTPARLKFMKSDRAEGSACVLAAFRCALGRPDISVRCIRDGEEQFFSPGDSRMESCVYSLLGRDQAAKMLFCAGGADGVKVEGYVSSPGAGRGNRSAQHFYCNGRVIKSAALQSALEQAYKNTLLVGKFPACVLYLTLSFGAVDVNVHPAKTEVKFTQEKAVFDAVYYAVRSALERESPAAAVHISAGTQKKTEPRADFYQTMSAAEYRAKQSASAKREVQYAPPKPYPAPGISTNTTFRSPTVAPAAPVRPPMPRPISAPAPRPEPRPVPQLVQTALESFEEKAPAAVPEQKARIIGEAMNAYILIEKGDTLLLIDKHAAHERINFDRLQKQTDPLMSQTLLSPVPFSPGGTDAEVLRMHADSLEQMGFEIEPLSGDDFMIRAVPEIMSEKDAAAALEEICRDLRHGGELDVHAARDEILKTVACKAAIKAGWNTAPQELLPLAEAVLSGEVKYCPHGRPVAVTLTRKELDKLFLRIV